MSARSAIDVTGLSPERIRTPGSTRTVAFPPVKSNTPAREGAEAGSTMVLPGALPKVFAPSFSQNRPVTVSQPPSAFSRSSRFARHCSTSAT